jgi:hypothetical protein
MDFAIVQRIYQPAAAGPLGTARPTVPAPPVPPAATPHPGQQNNPRYQPALQQPQPGMAGAGTPR